MCIDFINAATLSPKNAEVIANPVKSNQGFSMPGKKNGAPRINATARIIMQIAIGVAILAGPILGTNFFCTSGLVCEVFTKSAVRIRLYAGIFSPFHLVSDFCGIVISHLAFIGKGTYVFKIAPCAVHARVSFKLTFFYLGYYVNNFSFSFH